jgi:hypothetical protein
MELLIGLEVDNYSDVSLDNIYDLSVSMRFDRSLLMAGSCLSPNTLLLSGSIGNVFFLSGSPNFNLNLT